MKRQWALAGVGGGIAIVVAAGLSSGAGDAFAALASPPPLFRAVLVGLAAVAGAYLLVLALRRMDASRETIDPATDAVALTTAQLGTMVRGIRFVFLAAAALAAGIGWLIGNPLPIVVGLVIAGVDIAETSFLLLVATARGSRDRG